MTKTVHSKHVNTLKDILLFDILFQSIMMTDFISSGIPLISEANHFKQLLLYYQEGCSCDLRISCHGEKGSVACHRLILSTVSTWMKKYLRNSYNQEEAMIVLPASCSLYEVKMFLDELYYGLAKKGDITFGDSVFCVAQALGLSNSYIGTGTDAQTVDEIPENVFASSSTVKPEVTMGDYDDDFGTVEFSDYKEESEEEEMHLKEEEEEDEEEKPLSLCGKKKPAKRRNLSLIHI